MKGGIPCFFISLCYNSREELTTRKGAYGNQNDEEGSVFSLLEILFYLGLNETLDVKWYDLD